MLNILCATWISVFHIVEKYILKIILYKSIVHYLNIILQLDYIHIRCGNIFKLGVAVLQFNF